MDAFPKISGGGEELVYHQGTPADPQNTALPAIAINDDTNELTHRWDVATKKWVEIEGDTALPSLSEADAIAGTATTASSITAAVLNAAINRVPKIVRYTANGSLESYSHQALLDAGAEKMTLPAGSVGARIEMVWVGGTTAPKITAPGAERITGTTTNGTPIDDTEIVLNAKGRTATAIGTATGQVLIVDGWSTSTSAPMPAVTYLTIPLNNTIPTGDDFSFNVTTTGAAPFFDFSDGTPTVQSASGPATVTGAPPRVVTLRIPSSEAGLMTGLNLNSNQITAIPSQIGSLSALSVLYLSFNQITAIPSQIGSLTALTQFDISYNQITAIPSQIGSLSALSVLNLSGNQIAAVPPQIGSLTALTQIYLSYNQITAMEIVAFAQLVAANSDWDNCVIDFSNNPGSAAAAIDANFIAAKATLEGRGCIVTT